MYFIYPTFVWGWKRVKSKIDAAYFAALAAICVKLLVM